MDKRLHADKDGARERESGYPNLRDFGYTLNVQASAEGNGLSHCSSSL